MVYQSLMKLLEQTEFEIMISYDKSEGMWTARDPTDGQVIGKTKNWASLYGPVKRFIEEE